MPSAPTIFILPGWLGSGPNHWQSLWEPECADMRCVRVDQHDWQRPLRGDWCARLDEMIVNHLAAVQGALLNTEQTIDSPRRKTAYFSSENLVEHKPPSIILAAHSLGCHLVAAWAGASRHTHAVRGALLVAPPDVTQADLPSDMHNWRTPVLQTLPFAATCVVSGNDPFCSPAAAHAMAKAWGAQCIDAGALGHINGESGLGAWPAGQAWLRALASAPSAATPITPSS